MISEKEIEQTQQDINNAYILFLASLKRKLTSTTKDLSIIIEEHKKFAKKVSTRLKSMEYDSFVNSMDYIYKKKKIVPKWYDELDEILETMNSFDNMFLNARAEILPSKLVESGLIKKEVIGTELGKLSNQFSNYYKVLTSISATESAAFSKISLFSKYNIRTMRWIGFRDDLTCPVCSRFIGRIFKTSTLKTMMDNYLAETEIDGIKKSIPFIEYDKKNNEYFRNIDGEKDYLKYGEIDSIISIPPLHTHCRCELVAE